MTMTHRVKAVKYDSTVNPEFQRVLKARVHDYLAEQSNGRFANGYMAFKVFFFLAAYWGLWTSLVFFEHSALMTFTLITAFSSVIVALAYNVSHDAVHRTLSRRGWVNELLFHGTFNVLGPNAYLWRLRHRVMHHNCVNIPGLDFNIEASDILRFAPTQEWKPIHRYQHLYAPIAYCLFTIHWVFIKDFQMLKLHAIGNVEGMQHSRRQVLGVVAWKVFYVFSILALPMIFTSWAWWQVLLGFLYLHAVASFQFVITFTGSHLNRGMVFVPYEGGRVPHSFLEHQLRTSLDFHPTSPLFSFFLGGFNAHVAHHMFPQVCSVHYPAITRIIQATAAEYDLPYQQMNVAQLYYSHFAYLWDMGRGPREADADYLYTA